MPGEGCWCPRCVGRDVLGDWYYDSNFGEAWHSDIPKGMVGALEDRHSYRNWPDSFRWLVRSTYQAQRRIRAWSDYYRSLETDDTTQESLSLLD